MTTLSDLKIQFNEKLALYHKACRWLDDDSIPKERKNKWLQSGKWQGINKELSTMLKEYETMTGLEITEQEVMTGFII